MLELGVRVLALDTDMAIVADPFTVLRDPAVFGRFQLVTTFDFKGGFANTNIGFVCLQNATLGGPVHALFHEFEARVKRALEMPHRRMRANQRASFINKFVWDQNLFNKVLLSAMAGHAAYLPDESDMAWTTANKPLLRARRYWRQPMPPIGPPRWLGASEPYFPRDPLPVSSTPWAPMRFNALWTALPVTVPVGALASPSCSSPSGAILDAPRYCGSTELALLAPAWLVAMEQGIGHKLKHVAYGVSPSPAVIIHFTCTTQTEAARVWPLRLYGYWHAAAVAEAEAVLSGSGGALTLPPARRASESTPATAATITTSQVVRAASRAIGGDVSPPRMIALVDGLIDNPLPPLPWATLNAFHAMLGSLASLTGRALVLPSINCTGVTAGNLGEEKLSGRCFWHLQSAHGVRCVLRIGSCEDPPLATPAEAAAAVGQVPASRSASQLDLTEPVQPSAVEAIVVAAATDARIVLVSLKLPPPAARSDRHRDTHSQQVLDVVAEHVSPHATLARHLKAFRRRCSDLTTRSKQGSECNNICS